MYESNVGQISASGRRGRGATLDGTQCSGFNADLGQSASTFYNAPTETAPRWIIDRDLLGGGLSGLAFKQSGAGTVAADGGAIGQPAADGQLFTRATIRR